MRHRPARLGLLGGECTGKSTLAAALGSRLPACVVDEAARDFVLRQQRPPRAEEQATVLAEQIARAATATASCAHDWVVVDPAPLMTAVYSVLYFGDDTLVPTGVEDALHYDLLVWCAPDLPWQPESGMRDGPQYRDAVDRLLADVVHDLLRPRGAHVARVTGPTDARAADVTATIARPG